MLRQIARWARILVLDLSGRLLFALRAGLSVALARRRRRRDEALSGPMLLTA